MQEDLKKNFILLSKIAKEKKYAQEYLGLLARRGDIGSIRIGKRWYTTWQWFEEFLENSQKKPSFVPLSGTMAGEEKEIKISAPFVFPEREKVFVAVPAMNVEREERVADQPARIAVAVKTRNEEMIGRKNITGDISLPAMLRVAMRTGGIGGRREIKIQPRIAQSRNLIQETKFRNISVAERNKHAVPYPKIEFKEKADVFSPDLSNEENMFASMFSRFAFAFSFAMILLLVAASGYFVWSGGLLKSGQVAGASDERNGGISGIKSGSEYVLVSAGDKIKQSLSLSKLIVQAARERGN